VGRASGGSPVEDDSDRYLLADPGLHGVLSASFYLTLSYKARPGGEITG